MSSRFHPSKVRPPAVAGQFYPGDERELRHMIGQLLRGLPPWRGRAPKAVIAPHAGYVYSGPIAASAYTALAAAREVTKRVVLVGPSHRVPFHGLAAPTAEAFATPLGQVPVDGDAIRQISGLPQVQLLDEAHADEHSLEVQLPFLQTVLADYKIVPLVVGDARDEAIAEVLETLWNGAATRLVISSDLSHYLPYPTARDLDAATARAIEQLCPQDLDDEQACGAAPIRGLLCAARWRGLRARTIDLRNSGDTAGSRHQVVGYGAFVFEEPDAGQGVR